MKRHNRGSMLQHVAIRLAGEGVPINVIARAMLETRKAIQHDMMRAVSLGILPTLPADDWPDQQKGVRAAMTAPQVSAEDIATLAARIGARTRFTRQQSMFVACLMANDVALHPTIMAAISPSVLADSKIINVVACQVRPALRALGAEFRTVWGEGYQLAPTGRACLQRLIDAVPVTKLEAADEKAA